MTIKKLQLVKTSQPAIEPARALGEHGRRLWDAVMAEYDVRDAGGLELLCLACAGLDRAEELKEQIDRDGQILYTKNGAKDHPALRHELANRSFVARQLSRLGIDAEPLKSIGRPPLLGGHVE